MEAVSEIAVGKREGGPRAKREHYSRIQTFER